MSDKKRIKAGEFINDIRMGKRISELMQKYGLSPKTIHQVFRKLVEADLLSKRELDDREMLYKGAANIVGVRKSPRKRLDPPLPVFDSIEPFSDLLVLDVSETGIRVEGVNATVGEEKTFKIKPRGSEDRATLVFTAKCRWVKKPEHAKGRSVAGFEIIDISGYDAEVLQKLLVR